MNSGSALDVRSGQREVNELDSMTTLHNAILQNYGYRAQAQSDTAQAGLDEAQGTDALIGAGLNTAGGLIGSASAVGPKWTGAQASGGSGVGAGPLDLAGG